MTTLKSSVRIAGQVISNNDPQMVITLDPHAGVQISSIQDDSITYEFKGGVTQEALYNLNLTFTYQGRYEVKVPCTFKHTVVQVDYEVRPVETIVKTWDNGNSLPFQVWSGGEDITSQLTEVQRGVDPAGKMFDYSFAPNTPDELKKNWWIISDGSPDAQDLTIPYTFKLPVSIDPAQQVRSTNGIFKLLAYDGIDIKTEYTDAAPFLVEVNTSKIINIDVWYKGYFAPTKSVSFLPDSSDVRPFTVNGNGGPDPKRFQVSLAAGNTPSSATIKIVLGTSLTNQVEGKNISTVNVESKIYRKGLVILKSPAAITGETGTDHETTVDFEYNGLPIDANELVWSNGAGDLRFASATGDKVTWTIMKANNGSANLEVDTAISVKKGTDAPQTYVQKVNVTPKALTVVYTTQESALKGASNNLIGIKVTDASGAGVTGMTAKSLTVVSSPNNPAVSSGYSKALTAGAAGVYNISVDLGHLPGEITINLTLEKGGIETVVPAKVYNTPGTPITSVAVPNTINAGEDVSTVITFKQARGVEGTITDVTGTLKLQQSGPGMTIVDQFAVNPDNTSSYIGKVRGDTPGTQGQIKFTLEEAYSSFTHDWVDVYTDFTVDVPLSQPIEITSIENPLVGVYDTTENMTVVLSQGGNNLPLNGPNMVYSFEPEGYLELVSVQPTALVVKLIHEPSVEIQPTPIKLKVTDGVEHAEQAFLLETKTNKPKPTMTVVRRVTGKRFEKGNLPIMVTVGDMDYFYTASNWVTKTPSDYVAIDETGQWTVTNAGMSPVETSVQVGFTVTQNGVAWVYLATVEFDIEPSPAQGVFSVNGQPDRIVGAVGEESTITVYPTLLGQAVPDDINVEFSGASAANVTLVGTAVSPSGRGLDITYRGVSTIKDQPVTVVYKVKGLPGETEGADKITNADVPLYVFEPDQINVIQSTINPTSLVGPDGTEFRVYMELYRGGQPYPISDSRNMVYASAGVVANKIDAEWLNVRLSGAVGARKVSFQIYDRANSSNRAMFDLDTEITEGVAERKAMWYPIPFEDLQPSTNMVLKGPLYSYGGSGLGSFVNNNVTFVNTPGNGNACDNMPSGMPTVSNQATAEINTGHTGDEFIVRSDMVLAGTVNYKQESRPINVLQAPWVLEPTSPNGWEIDSSVKGKVTVIEFKAKQVRLTGDHYLDQGTFTRLRFSGPILNIGAPTRVAADTWSVPITSDGTLGNIQVTGQLIEAGINYPFEFWLSAGKSTDTLEMTNVPASITVDNGAIYTIPVNLKYNGAELPFTSEGIKARLDNVYVQILGYDASGLKVRFDSPLQSEFKRYDLNATVMYKGKQVFFKVTVREMLTGKTKPTMTITGDVTARLGDTGRLPVVFKNGEDDITNYAYEFVTVGGDDYLDLKEDGSWEIIKEDATQITLTQPFYINVWFNGVKWSYSPDLTFHIGPDVPSPVLTNPSVELIMDLWESKVVPYTVMLGETDISSSVTSIVVNNPETLSDRFEFIDTAQAWAFKSIKSSPDTTLGTTANVSVIGTHEGNAFNLPMTVALKTNPNPGTIETQRFKVEAV